MSEAGRTKVPRATTTTRVYEDTAEMLAWVLYLEGKKETTADFIERHIRAEVEKRFAPLRKRVEAVKAAERGEPVGAGKKG